MKKNINYLPDFHLDTIWQPEHSIDTIDEHTKILGVLGRVKWLIIYGKNIDFKKPLTKEDIEVLNRRADKDDDRYLYIRCLDERTKEKLFYKAKIKKVESTDKSKIKSNDPELPKYYQKVLLNPELKIPYIITILTMEEIDEKESKTVKLIEDFKTVSRKYGYSFPCKAYVTKGKHKNNKETQDPTNKLRPSQKHKKEARKFAKGVWSKNKETTIKNIIFSPEFNKIFNGKKYTKKTLRNWIKDLCPNRRPGRRKKLLLNQPL